MVELDGTHGRIPKGDTVKTPYHLMDKVATIAVPIADGGFSVDDTGQAFISSFEEWTDIPCRITPLSGSEGMDLGGENGRITYSGLFPSPDQMKSDFGITDGHIPAQARVTVTINDESVLYRVIGPATIQTANVGVLQRCILETENDEVPPL